MSDTLNIIRSPGPDKTTRRIDLGDCDESLRGAVFDVWVTPTRAHVQAYIDYQDWLKEEPVRRQSKVNAIEDAAERERVDQEMAQQTLREMYERLDAWMAETWVNIPAEEVPIIRERLQGDDDVSSSVWRWLYDRTFEVIADYREQLTKN